MGGWSRLLIGNLRWYLVSLLMLPPLLLFSIPGAADAPRASKRARQRATYAPTRIVDGGSARQIIDLAGKWLFIPSQELGSTAAGPDPGIEDESWHVLGVPQFWQPIEWWLYTRGDGASHNYLRRETARCEEFTFDYKATRSGWYRRWIEIPRSLADKRLVLKFDAVASAADVYWNGERAGSHVGMFGPFECEVTEHVRFGKPNLLAVFVAAGKVDPKAAGQVAGVAVTAVVTKDMLNSLPRGSYRPGLAGIWQPARLEITGRDRIADVFFRPRLDGAVIETTVDGKSGKALRVAHTVSDSSVLYSDKEGQLIPAGQGTRVARADVTGLHPRLWSPEHPNLYSLETRLLDGETVVDEAVAAVGFRTFEVRGNRLYLNGRPYFMRGGNMPPHGLAPSDGALADKFMKLLHDGNVMVTRLHTNPAGRVWLDAADRHGVGVSPEGHWPWVLLHDNPVPARELIETWKGEMVDLVRACRNHPSLLFWTVTNESHFEGTNDPDEVRRLEKYRIFSDVIKAMREVSPDTPIVFHSGYSRQNDDYEKLLKPNGLDDGDIDDGHWYFGWYWASAFHIDVARDVEGSTAGKRPLISQEACTGYPDNDTGHPIEKYIRDHFVPQVWIGNYAGYDHRPDVFLETHAQITKECAEKIRRERTFLSGWGLFSTSAWFKDVYNAERVTPYPVYWEVRKAWQPVLVSLETANRHFEAGGRFDSDVYVINDDPDLPKLTDLTVTWRIWGQSDDVGTSGSVSMPDCEQDGKSKQAVTFEIPSKLPSDRANMTLELVLTRGDEVVSRNDYPIICCTREWYSGGTGDRLVVVDSGRAGRYLEDLGFQCDIVKAPDWGTLETGALVVVGPGVEPADGLREFISRGGTALIIGASTLPGLLPDGAQTVDAEGEFVDVLIPELLDGMDPMDMRWWNAEPGGQVRVCRAAYRLPDSPGIAKLARHIAPHDYIRKEQLEELTSWPVFEVGLGAGRAIISSLLLADDPLAKRFTRNLVKYVLE